MAIIVFKEQGSISENKAKFAKRYKNKQRLLKYSLLTSIVTNIILCGVLWIN